MPSAFGSFLWFNRQHFVLGYFAQALLQNAWKVGWDRYMMIYYVHVSNGSVSRWVATCELNQMCFCFELLRGCCYGATSVPTSVRTGDQRNCHCTLQDHLNDLKAGASWVGKWPLHALISISPFQTYCCWNYVFFAKYCCDRGITVWRVYMFCFAPHCFGQVFLGDLKPLKHQGTTKTLNGNPPLQVCPQNITFKCFVWFALNECIVWAERMITTFDCGPD